MNYETYCKEYELRGQFRINIKENHLHFRDVFKNNIIQQKIHTQCVLHIYVNRY